MSKSKSKMVLFKLYPNLLSETNPNGDGTWKYGVDQQGTTFDFGNGYEVTEQVLYKDANGNWISNANTTDYSGWKRTRMTLPVEFIGMTEEEVINAGFSRKIMVDVLKDQVMLGDGIEPVE